MNEKDISFMVFHKRRNVISNKHLNWQEKLAIFHRQQRANLERVLFNSDHIM